MVYRAWVTHGSISQTNTQTNTLTYKHTHSHTHSQTHSHTVTHTLTHTHTHSHTQSDTQTHSDRDWPRVRQTKIETPIQRDTHTDRQRHTKRYTLTHKHTHIWKDTHIVPLCALLRVRTSIKSQTKINPPPPTQTIHRPFLTHTHTHTHTHTLTKEPVNQLTGTYIYIFHSFEKMLMKKMMIFRPNF